MARRPRKIDYDFAIKTKRTETVGSILNTLIRFGAVVLIFYFGKEMVEALAGKYTFADIGIAFMGELRASRGIATAAMAIFGLSGIGYGLRERKLRRDDIEQRSHYIAELESGLDRKRTSSLLTKRGTTRPEERV